MTSQTPAHTPIVVRCGALGDLILLTPLLHLLHRRYGRPCLLIGAGGWMQPLFAGHPDVAATLPISFRRCPYTLDPSQWRVVSALRIRLGGPGLDVGVARAFFPEDVLLLYHGMRPMAAPHVRCVPDDLPKLSIT